MGAVFGVDDRIKADLAPMRINVETRGKAGDQLRRLIRQGRC
jgi:hypothetical protein